MAAEPDRRPQLYIDEWGTTTKRSYTQVGGPENTRRTFTGGADNQLSATTYDSAGRPSGLASGDIDVEVADARTATSATTGLAD